MKNKISGKGEFMSKKAKLLTEVFDNATKRRYGIIK